MKKYGFLIFSVIALSSCTKYASNAEKMYLSARNSPVVMVSPPLTNENISHFYVLPNPQKDPRVNIEPPV